MTTKTKPAKLQLNARGSWKDVCRFEVTDATATAHIMEAAATLATYSTDKPTMRLVSDEAIPVPLMRWRESSGWAPWRDKP